MRRRASGRFSMHDTVRRPNDGRDQGFGVTLRFVVATQATDGEWPLQWPIDAGAPGDPMGLSRVCTPEPRRRLTACDVTTISPHPAMLRRFLCSRTG